MEFAAVNNIGSDISDTEDESSNESIKGYEIEDMTEQTQAETGSSLSLHPPQPTDAKEDQVTNAPQVEPEQPDISSDDNTVEGNTSTLMKPELTKAEIVTIDAPVSNVETEPSFDLQEESDHFPSDSILERKDHDLVMQFLKEKAEDCYVDEIGLEEASFYRKGKVNDPKLISYLEPDLKMEIEESGIPETFNEIDPGGHAENSVPFVRTLTGFSMYDKYGNLCKLSEILEKPYVDYSGDIVVFGTVLAPLPRALQWHVPSAPPASNREKVRAELEKPIPRGFRQSEIGSITPESIANGKVPGRGITAEKKATATKKSPLNRAYSRPTNPKTNLNFVAPTYDSSVTREEAFQRAQDLRSKIPLPLKVGNIRVLNLGTVVRPGEPGWQNYHNDKHLFPVGYKSVRLYGDLRNPTEHGSYTSEIIRGENGPIFRVTYEEEALGEPVYEASTSSAVWLKVLKALNESKIHFGLPAKGTSISGPEMMGFAHKKIASVLEGLDGAIECTAYIFRSQRVDNIGRGTGVKRKANPEASVTKEAATARTETSITSPGFGKSKEGGAVQQLFSTNNIPKSKKLKSQKSYTGPILPEEQFKKIKHISKQISLITTNEEKQLQNSMLQLKDMNVNFQVLTDTGLGNVIYRLRKHSCAGVASLAKSLRKHWKENSDKFAHIICTQQDKAEVRKICGRITSYVGFGDESPPPNFRAHLSKHAARLKLLSMLNSLDTDFEYIPVHVLMETQTGQRVNKLRKHLDEDIQAVALKLKSRWKKQVLEEPETPMTSSLPYTYQNKSGGNSYSSSTVTSNSKQMVMNLSLGKLDHLEIEKHRSVSLPDNLVSLANEAVGRARVRVKILEITGLEITHGKANAILWLKTKSARYKLGGNRVDTVPSHRYYRYFVQGFHVFQSACYSISAWRAYIHAAKGMLSGMSAPALRKHKVQALLHILVTTIRSSVHCPCPNPSQKEIIKVFRILKEDRWRRLTTSTIVSSYETIIDELTRLGIDFGHWFIQNLINRGNCEFSKAKRSSVRREKEYTRSSQNGSPKVYTPISLENTQISNKTRLEAQGRKMVAEGFCLPDDLILLEDDKLPESERKYKYLPKKQQLAAKPGLSLIYPDLLLLTPTQINPVLLRQGETKNLVLGPELFPAIIALWLSLRTVNDIVQFNEDFESFDLCKFVRKLFSENILDIWEKLLLFVAEDSVQGSWEDLFPDNLSSGHQAFDSEGVTTRASEQQNDVGFVLPLDEVTDKTSCFVYNKDEAFPFPRFLVSKLSTVELARRMLQKELLEETARIEKSESNMFPMNEYNFLDGGLRHPKSKLYAKVDLLDACEEILLKIVDNPLSAHFSSPVDTSEYPDYLELVNRPMDLGTIRNRLQRGHYNNKHVTEDMRKTYCRDIVMPVIRLEEPKGNEQQETSSSPEVEEEGSASHDSQDEEEEMSEDLNKSSEYVISRKVRKKGVWKYKSDYQLGVELREKMNEVREQLLDDRYYSHDCKGGGYQGVLADVRQVWRNCRKYNKSFTKVYNDSKKLEEVFMGLYTERVLRRSFEHSDTEENRSASDATGNITSTPEYAIPLTPLPTLQDLLAALEDDCDFSIESVSFQLQLTNWLVDKVFESSKYKAKQLRNLNAILDIDKKEVESLKADQRKSSAKGEDTDLTKSSISTQAIDREGILFKLSNKLEPVGEDRYRNRIWFLWPIVLECGTLFIEEVKTETWHMLNTTDQLRGFLDSLDVRGKRENRLHKNLSKRIKLLVERNKAFEVEHKSLSSSFAQLAPLTEAELEGIRNKIRDLEFQAQELRSKITELEPEASLWKTAVSEGTEYYYHKHTRESTWVLPQKTQDLIDCKAKLKRVEAEVTTLRSKEDPNYVEGEKIKIEARLSQFGHLHKLFDQLKEKNLINPETNISRSTLGDTVVRNTFRAHLLLLLSTLMALENMTIKQSGGINYSPRIRTWFGSGRINWLDDIQETFDSIKIKQGKVENIREIIRNVRNIMKTLFLQYCGDPYPLDDTRAQEAVLRCTRHETRVNRAIEYCNNLFQLGLVEAHIRHVLGIKIDSKFRKRVEANRLSLQEA
eukprot:snap_masked-scaffold_4-processed-gene-19.51-mRNA-1 protein AED:1.00 eAED:1.00 QI:0/-1/0/0/-1/1/1/0/2062